MLEIVSATHYYVQADRSCVLRTVDGKLRDIAIRFDGTFVDGRKMSGPAEFHSETGSPWGEVHGEWIRYCKLNGLWDKDNDN